MRKSYGKLCDRNVTAGLILQDKPGGFVYGRHMPQGQPDIAPAAVFLIRIWPEPGSAGGWRGFAQHVQSGQSAYFADARKLLLFIAAHGAVRFADKEVNPKEDTNRS